MIARRTDRAEQPRRTGPRTYRATIARAHSVSDALEYPHGRETRTREELRRACVGVAGIPVVLEHNGPRVGHVVLAAVAGDHMIADLALEAAGERALEGGAREVSIGYGCKVDAAGAQSQIEITEVALVEVGTARCGGACAVRLDAKGRACACADADAASPKVPPRRAQWLRDLGTAPLGRSLGAQLTEPERALAHREAWRAPLTAELERRRAAKGSIR